MRGTRNHEIFFLLIFFSEPLGVLLLPGLAGGRSRTQRDVHCRENQEYLHGNICCLNCPAGTRLESPCTTAGRRGKCVECDDGTYTSHSNSLKWCIGCTKCREDQQIVKPCIHTQDAECQCKPGRFCVPAEACEVCKKCSRCGKDEVAVRNCTPTANTECKKIQPNLDSSSANIPWIVIVVVLAAVAAVFVGVLFYWKRCRSSDSQRELPGGLKAGQLYNDAEEGRNGESQMLSYTSLILPRPLVRAKPFACIEEERKVLCESLDSSASNSQHSLTGPPLYAAPLQPDEREEKQFPTLIPVNGEESLRKCFEYFEEIDIDCHRRFFRHLGINDNVIKSKDGLPYDDKIHDLLNVWVEKEGIGASLNDLLRALLDLNQRLTAERVKDKAILNDHYFCEE
ncbi:tumor necrosis factor receptor superfamily member 10B-like isoform X1 [Sparus aurata]|uniref:Hematopoietic death receptor n=2 Tax=Sparus aurata TaxID=8175 RepID=A0A671VX50_SPAAU|nr:tumor necrosis factor receptor superfamily member 10B-like isoform X1 [Sparus aurata]